ncbi:rhodanese-like domain-containing protein [Ascidiaceihabitans sp.]|uniref:rhodanese-like domain-containing protein n=1 Tax=Ascidiaceihabitans sp. TaxID=1872644 RepID=UPI003296BFD5
MSDPSPSLDRRNPRPRLSRRGVLVGASVVALGGLGVFGAKWFNVTARAGQKGQLSVQQAHVAAKAGDIVLVDIRRPDEWAHTGVGAHAVPLDMRRKDFAQALLAYVNHDASHPVALICARGVRSRAMTARLTKAGFTNIIDVPEGMLGSGAGPGWLKSGLPVVRPE